MLCNLSGFFYERMSYLHALTITIWMILVTSEVTLFREVLNFLKRNHRMFAGIHWKGLHALKTEI